MNKKQHILDAAAKLFATQGFDGTTTLQIANQANVTEPLIYYHFKGKDELFTSILQDAFDRYFDRLESLPKETASQFDKIADLIALHFSIVEDMPEETFLVFNTCPAKLNDADHVCRTNIERHKRWWQAYLTDCLNAGIRRGEFEPMPIEPTVEMLEGFLSGVMRRRALRLETSDQTLGVMVDFCRKALVKS